MTAGLDRDDADPRPQILIADELTSTFSENAQQQVLKNLEGLFKERGMGFLSRIASDFFHRILIMYPSRIVEVCDADRLREAQRFYTRGLLNSLPLLDQPKDHLLVLRRDLA